MGKDLYSSRSSLLYALQYVLLFLNSSFDHSKYDKLLKAQQSIPYLLRQVNQWLSAITHGGNEYQQVDDEDVMAMMSLDRTQSVNNTLPSQIELGHIMADLSNKWKCLKLKMIAVKNIRLAQRN